MLTRRTVLTLMAGSVAAPGLAAAQTAPRKVALYANVGADLTHYDVDIAGSGIEQLNFVHLWQVQAWSKHISRRGRLDRRRRQFKSPAGIISPKPTAARSVTACGHGIFS